MIYSWQTVNYGNLAEQVCRPTDYCDLGQPVIILPQDYHPVEFEKGPLIFGASGLLYPEIAPILEAAVKSKRHPVIAWGIGHNTHGGTAVQYPDWLRLFDLVGLRDFKTEETYVPCPSCLNPAFNDLFLPPAHPLVVYDQIDYPVAAKYEGVPRDNNCHPAAHLGQILQFLSSGETVVTSSYHGVYWAQLLGRRAVLWKPWSTKFNGFQYPPEVIEEECYKFKPSTCPPTFLEECRIRNVDFAERVRSVCDL